MLDMGEHLDEHLANRLDALLAGQARIEAVLAEFKPKQRSSFQMQQPLHRASVHSSSVLQSCGLLPPAATSFSSRRSRAWADPQPQAPRVQMPLFGTNESVEAESGSEAEEGRVSVLSSRFGHCSGWSLPDDWPKCLSAKDFKAQGTPVTHEQILSRLSVREDQVMVSASKVDFREQPLYESERRWRRCPRIGAVHPYSTTRVAWDQVSCLVLAYELMMLPVVLAWDINFTGSLSFIAYATFLFWASDLVMNFFTGFSSHGIVITDLRRSAMAYLRGWFILDFAILGCNGVSLWLNMPSNSNSDNPAGITLLRFAKGVRVLRIASVMRMLRITETVKRLADQHTNDQLLALIEIPGLMLVMVFVSHVFACSWFAISKYSSSDTGRAWVTSLVANTDFPYSDASMAHQYFTAYHWALSQMTSGAMGLQAENTTERIFNIGVLIVGVVLSSTIISRLTAKLAEYSSMKSKQKHWVSSLSGYLRKAGVDHKLVIAASLQAKDRFISVEQSAFDPTSALDMLPLNTRAALYHEICCLNLCHTLFRLWEIIDGSRLLSMSFKQFVTFDIFGKHEAVFEAGAEATSAYVVMQGKLAYTQQPETSKVPDTISEEVQTGTFLAEAVLYCDWIHVGTAEVMKTTDVVSVQSDMFGQEIQKSVIMSWLVKEFAKVYLARLTAERTSGHPSDVPEQSNSTANIVPFLSKDVLDVIGLSTIQALKERHISRIGVVGNMTNKKGALLGYCAELQEEVFAGKCIMTLHGDGSLERITTVVTLKVFGNDLRFLAHIASIKEDRSRKAKVELPGGKKNGGETTNSVLRRVMKGWLKPFEKYVDLIAAITTSDKVTKRSEYPLKLTYMRTIVDAKVNQEFRSPGEHLVTVPMEGPLCGDLKVHSVILLARRAAGKEETEYSLWAWLRQEEYDLLSKDDAPARVTEALKEMNIPESAFAAARACYDDATTTPEPAGVSFMDYRPSSDQEHPDDFADTVDVSVDALLEAERLEAVADSVEVENWGVCHMVSEVRTSAPYSIRNQRDSEGPFVQVRTLSG